MRRLTPTGRPRRCAYGAVGGDGLGGVDAVAVAADSGQVRHTFEPGVRYNVECGRVIVRPGPSLQGAHANLLRAEPAGLVREAAPPG
ncbi:hypothetical protein ACFV0T_29770 [Streptomyces sp. NPDC059582]|uniref:hypothetical protein n=1 Tax=Streptomyces sp. NPDC059582 TaxID=3346875 RepID=UPI0036B86EFC